MKIMKMKAKYFAVLYYLLLLIGFTITSWIIYSRFIRERLPKDIPMFLTEHRFWFLLYLCLIYGYMLKTLIFQKTANQDNQEVVKHIKEFLYKPLLILDQGIKYNKYCKNLYYKFINTFIEQLYSLTSKQQEYCSIIFQIIPRIVLGILLFRDVFYFHKIEIFYTFLLLGFIPLLYNYLKHSITEYKDHLIELLENKYAFVWFHDKGYGCPENWEDLEEPYEHTEANKYHEKDLTLKEYFAFKIKTNVYNLETADYIEAVLAKETTYNDYIKDKYKVEDADLTDEDRLQIDKEFEELKPKIIKLGSFIETFKIVERKSIILRTLKFISFSLYLTCWSFVLLLSYFHFPITTFPSTMILLLKTLYNIEEPFSGIL